MGFRGLGCVRCRTLCVASGHMTRARRSLGRARMLLHGSWLLLAVWVGISIERPFFQTNELVSGRNRGLHWQPWRSVPHSPDASCQLLTAPARPPEIVMVRLQGHFAKPPEQRFNYKHCFDALFRVCLIFIHLSIPRPRTGIAKALARASITGAYSIKHDVYHFGRFDRWSDHCTTRDCPWTRYL